MEDDNDDNIVSTFTPKQYNTLLLITLIESSISLVGSLLIISSYLRFKRLRKFSLQLVFWLSVSDVGNSISYFIGNPGEDSNLCTVQAMLMSMFELSSVLWTTVIAFTL